jgi:hypothetical protein
MTEAKVLQRCVVTPRAGTIRVDAVDSCDKARQSADTQEGGGAHEDTLVVEAAKMSAPRKYDLSLREARSGWWSTDAGSVGRRSQLTAARDCAA